MNTLIVYGTKHGTTEKCASLLSKKLNGKVDLHNLKTAGIPDIAPYDKVIIGGSIYAGRIQKEISQFCTQNLNAFKNKKMGLFICAMFKDNAEAQLKNSFPEELLNAACAKECFGGEMKFSVMSFGEKFITKMVSKMAAKKDATLPPLDTKKDISLICEETIDQFAELMNNSL
ncbi:flavodoxin domain-containing protein [Petroclostridium sp. X23]|uniref:flavodoxin domain-containing protein n=1 Tax=Petroclostridium sp. X23 TaxID=3045146 RepID=UPI0024ADF78E|nr:flavodoxin domain-containing protein [Petroclostridium sp. X23]WHH57137.1 flavodoxin domain-containing protein [Petroclostridium sp. X23]